ncbi:MAG: glycosyltransferase family A protein [Anaerolineales bacterium]|nr:glycosyltransferase family 2 protein [Anaerolineales bacterium]
MARIGINPARGKISNYRPAKVTIALLIYIPHLEGYFQNRLDILRLALASVLANTELPFDLMVFDNGSCKEVVDYLMEMQDSGRIDYLLLSDRNIGKIGAFKILFRAVPGEIVAYADDDIFFYPGWIEAQLEILENFPQVGMVSGVPIRDASDRSRKSLLKWIEDGEPGLQLDTEYSIPDKWEMDWAESVGRDPAVHMQKIQDQKDLILTFKGVDAFGSASHFQFVTPKDVIVKALPDIWGGNLMGEMMELDQAIDALGYLRLSTVDRYTQHLGNILTPNMVNEAHELGLQFERKIQIRRKRKHWLLHIPGGGKILSRIYNHLFRILNNSD